MTDSAFDPKKIRDDTFYIQQVSFTKEDLQRIAYLEMIYTENYPTKAPFDFSKTISKAIEIAFANSSNPECGDLTQKRLEDLETLERRFPKNGKVKRKKQ